MTAAIDKQTLHHLNTAAEAIKNGYTSGHPVKGSVAWENLYRAAACVVTGSNPKLINRMTDLAHAIKPIAEEHTFDNGDTGKWFAIAKIGEALLNPPSQADTVPNMVRRLDATETNFARIYQSRPLAGELRGLQESFYGGLLPDILATSSPTVFGKLAETSVRLADIAETQEHFISAGAWKATERMATAFLDRVIASRPLGKKEAQKFLATDPN